MTSPYVRPDLATLQQLKAVTQALCDELASWRRRALRAEAELQEAQAQVAPSSSGTGRAQFSSEAENSAVAERLTEQELRLRRAREEVMVLKSRLRFVGDRSSRPA